MEHFWRNTEKKKLKEASKRTLKYFPETSNRSDEQNLGKNPEKKSWSNIRNTSGKITAEILGGTLSAIPVEPLRETLREISRGNPGEIPRGTLGAIPGKWSRNNQ